MSPVPESRIWPQPAPWRVARSAVLPSDASPSTSESPAPVTGDSHPEYIAFILVPIFFIMGLVGVLICHILKKKGYRCTTVPEPEAEEKVEGEKIEMLEGGVDTHNDTVGQIVSFIMKNEANADVLKAMVADNSLVADNSMLEPETPTTPNTPVSPTSPTSPLPTPVKHSCHLHTIGGAADKNACSRCAQKRWNPMKMVHKPRESKRGRLNAVTVLSVGRFRVTKVEPKSKERKRLMSETEGTNGEVPATPVSVDTRQRSGTETENGSTLDT